MADIILEATLDPKGVDDALKQIENRINQMVKSGDEDLQALAESLSAFTRIASQGIKDVDKQTGGTRNMKYLSPDEKTEWEGLLKEIDKVGKAMEVVESRIRSRKGIEIDPGISQIKTPRKILRDAIEKDIQSIRGDRLSAKLEEMMNDAIPKVSSAATKMNADLKKLLDDDGLSGSKLRKNLDVIESGIRRIGKEADQARPKVEEALTPRQQAKLVTEKDTALDDAEDLKDKLIRVMDQAGGVVGERAKEMRKDLIAMMRDPAVSGKELQDELNDIEKELQDVIDVALKRENLNMEAGSRGTGGRRDVLQEQRGRLIAGDEGAQLEQQLNRLSKSSQQQIREMSEGMKADLASIFKAPIESGELLERIRALKSEAEGLDAIKPWDVATQEEIGQLGDILTLMDQFDQAASKAASSSSATAQTRIEDQQRIVQGIRDRIDTGEKAALKETAAVNKAITSVTRLGKVYKEVDEVVQDVEESIEATNQTAQEAGVDQLSDDIAALREEINNIDPIDDKLIRQEAKKNFEELNKEIEHLSKSNKPEVKALASEIDKLGKEAGEAFDEGRMDAKDFGDEISKLRTKARRTADAFGEDLPQATNRSQVSMWKLGNAMDRVGVRGAGSAIRIADAFKGIPVAALAAVVAVAAVAAGVIKLVEALGRLGVAAAKEFGKMVKSALESAQAVQVTDVQLGSFLRAPELGPAYRKFLQSASFDVGLDLTKNFSRVVVPLARDLEEVEKAADIAGTLAHAFQETEEAISNAIKQASGGHFRPLIQRFGLTEFEIDRIQKAQEEYGEFTGVLKGLGEALEFRGLSIDTMAGTLQLLRGQLQVIKEQVLVTLGEPVRDALGEQLQKLFDLVDSRKSAILQFFEGLGETIGGVVASAGELVRDLVGDISDADFAELNLEISDLGQSVEDAIDALKDLLSADDRSIVDVMIDLTGVLTTVTEQLGEILQIFDGLSNIRASFDIGLPFTSAQFTDLVSEILGVNPPLVKSLASLLDLTTGDVGKAVKSSTTGGKGPVQGIGDLVKLIGLIGSDEGVTEEQLFGGIIDLGKAIPGIGNTIALVDSLKDSSDELAEQTDAVAEAENNLASQMSESEMAAAALIDQRQQIVSQLQDYEQMALAAEDAQERITKAEEKLAKDRTMREEQIRTQFARQGIEAEIKLSQNRENLFTKHMQNMLKMTDDLNFNNLQAGIDFDRKETDIYTKHADKLVDADREAADKKIDIEKKFRDRLKDIRAKFDLDAEEAIRRNDAVALLRIRRRMQLELDQAKTDRDRQEQEADDSAQKKRDDAKIWLDRAIRDNDLAEQHKLEDIIAADEQARKQAVVAYNNEYKALQKSYDEQEELRARREEQTLEDMGKQFDDREEELAKSLEQDYDTVEMWKDAETDYLKLKLQEQTNLFRKYRQLWIREGSLARHLIGSQFGLTGANPYLADNETGSGASAYYDPSGIGGRFRPEDEETLLSGGSVPLYGHGGLVTANNLYGINERGAEPFYATRAGVIQAHESMIMSPFGAGGLSNIDNSSHITADIYANDPTQMSPIQRTMMKHIITEEILANGV
jgi:hypothetical protein